jgi:uncharacterized membrane protein YbhN (UPF0104 family)
MSQAIKWRGLGRGRWLGRGLGLALLALILWRLDAAQVAAMVRATDPLLFGLAVAGLLPLIWLKTVRWQRILAALGLHYALLPAYLAYFGSLFVGLLTPGRLGEFVKAAHVRAECGATSAQALTSVLADRLFDLAALLVVGLAALVALPSAPLSLSLPPTPHSRFPTLLTSVGLWGARLLGPDGWLAQVQVALRRLSPGDLLAAGALTAAAYALYFGQCLLLARALGLTIGFWPVAFAVALGSLVTLLPISISGLGTREAVMIFYLGAAGVEAEAALSFSLLVFATFYLGSGALGWVAWWLKPAPWTGPAPTPSGVEPSS